MNCAEPAGYSLPCCQVESVVGIDERGQMVLPKEIREKAGIQAGDKLALVSWEQKDDIRFIALIKVKDLNRLVQKMMEPVLKEAAR